ncbi:hypothetical protein F9288_07965 [Sphingomonas sp. CL5.1]|uniref:hypothetical protein n=1 Tax=Sphingomonas sp. CL5.1 TaxID=2653203 RepID=UPI0015828D56|nr:hypothetical protein [Sphingomonas sp. CL5.1]QKR99586.1 hypothetical protein F9288_07965 [Sphingomonas sp. CL5.1]
MKTFRPFPIAPRPIRESIAPTARRERGVSGRRYRIAGRDHPPFVTSSRHDQHGRAYPENFHPKGNHAAVCALNATIMLNRQ